MLEKKKHTGISGCLGLWKASAEENAALQHTIYFSSREGGGVEGGREGGGEGGEGEGRGGERERELGLGHIGYDIRSLIFLAVF